MKKRKTRHDNERIRNIVKMYSENRTIVQIAYTLAISPHTVRTVLENEGVTMRKRGAMRLLTDIQVLVAGELYTNGHSTKYIAAALWTTPTVILRALRASGVPIRSRAEEARRGGNGRIG